MMQTRPRQRAFTLIGLSLVRTNTLFTDDIYAWCALVIFIYDGVGLINDDDERRDTPTRV